MTFRALFAIAAHLNLDIDQMNVKTTLLYGIIDQLIYVHMSTGYKRVGLVCKLLKALYDLKQSSRL